MSLQIQSKVAERESQRSPEVEENPKDLIGQRLRVENFDASKRRRRRYRFQARLGPTGLRSQSASDCGTVTSEALDDHAGIEVRELAKEAMEVVRGRLDLTRAFKNEGMGRACWPDQK